MPSIWKSGANAGRVKAGSKSIRGTISGPIPIPNALDDDNEFPIRSLGAIRSTKTEDEFGGIQRPGTGGIASPIASPTAIQAVEGGALKEQLYDNRHHDESSDSDRERSPGSRQGINSATFEIQGEHVGGDGISPVVSQRAKAPSDPPPLLPPNSAGAASSSTERQRTPQRTSPPQTSSPLRTTPMRVMTTPSTGRITNPLQSTALRYSTISDTPSGQTNNSKGQPQRKQSTLRSALGKLFGRGKKKNGLAAGEQRSPPNSERESVLMSQHKSDPSALHRTIEMSPKRSASLPISELDRPLRSHSIGPDDIRAIESARNSLQADIGGNSGSIARRRAAAANANERRFLFVPRFPEAEVGAGLSPRPASSHGRGSRLFAGVPRGEHDDPSEIGRAITSDSGSHGMRRRSRSLSGLPDILGAGIGRAPERRRSDEIRYWRESYNAGFHSPLSSDANVNADIDNDGVADLSVPASPAVERPPDTPPQPFNFGSISKQMVGMKITQAVTIDTRIGTLETRTGKLERVVDQLCHVVPGFRGPLSDISAVGGGRGTGGPGTIRTISDGRPSFTYTAASPPPPPISPVPPRQGQQPVNSQSDISHSPRASSERQSMDSDSHSQISFGEAQTFIGSLHPPSSSATQAQSLTTATTPTTAATLSLPPHPEEPNDTDRDRPTSNSTVRGVASMPSMHENATTASISEYSSTNAHNPTYYNQYHALLSQLDSERQARQALEGQVKKLSDRLNALSSTMYALVRDSGSWGAPDPSSPRSTISGGGGRRGRGHPPSHIPSVFDYDNADDDQHGEDDEDDEEDIDDNVDPAVRHGGHHSVGVVSKAKLALVAKPTSRGSGVGGRGGQEDDEAEDFQTPREEFQTPMTPTPPGYTYGAFSPEVESGDDEAGGDSESDARAEKKQKKAARTLSLSQLTMPKRI
ncbi:hypothetical protein SMACR_00345 [Sordaria macrospora]|uniref:Uncharacterized protein n=1 Tax=Sordaria macrospora TaxID=5147 RepID=A0A8S8ZCJ5_SORMA|nr:hypothetical protein SMACR_00345 [Sordaria macrospora]WPJ59089.1 hypothetical protein SMAC4_00345 [Sordaria macrospora]